MTFLVLTKQFLQFLLYDQVSEFKQKLNVALDTLQVISETVFTGQMTQRTASKHWRKQYYQV